MSSMSFMPQLKDFLKENKIIYTVRKYYMEDPVIFILDIGKAHRTLIKPIRDYKELLPYVRNSGFQSLEDWETQIDCFIPKEEDPRYLYKVEV